MKFWPVMQVIETFPGKPYTCATMILFPRLSSILTPTPKKLLGAGIAVIIISIVGFFVYQRGNSRSGYIFDHVQKTDITEVVTESGTIGSNGNVPIFSPTTGTISRVFVSNNQRVTTGQQLFTVVSSATLQEKQAAYANYLAAKTAVDADSAALSSLQSAMFSAWKVYTDMATNSTYQNSDKSPNAVNRTAAEFKTAEADWLAAEANYKNQQGVIAKNDAALASAYTAYIATQMMTVTSPLDGIIANLGVTNGNSVHAPSAAIPAPRPVLILKNSEDLEATIPVSQSNIAKIKIGEQVVLQPDAYKDKTYTAAVIRIDTLGENDQGVVTYTVYAEVKSDEFLRPGMTFDCDIITQKLTHALTVPNSAIVMNNGVKNVRLLQNNKIVYQPVIPGIKGQTRTQILKGLSENQEIIVALTNERAQRPGFLGL